MYAKWFQEKDVLGFHGTPELLIHKLMCEYR
jgi:hypothetical protein